VFPLVLPAMIDAWGPAVATRVLSVAIVCAIGPMLPFVRGRLPDTRVYGPAARSSDRSWMKNPMFWTLILVNTLQSFAYFVPIVWLPSQWTVVGKIS
jgi:MCP family monocarboxylic acid transporter-like MFS transporter 10